MLARRGIRCKNATNSQRGRIKYRQRKHASLVNFYCCSPFAVTCSGTYKPRHLAWSSAHRSTGRFPPCGLFTFDEEGKLASERIYYDRGTVLHQVGLYHNPQTYRDDLRISWHIRSR